MSELEGGQDRSRRNPTRDRQKISPLLTPPVVVRAATGHPDKNPLYSFVPLAIHSSPLRDIDDWIVRRTPQPELNPGP